MAMKRLKRANSTTTVGDETSRLMPAKKAEELPPENNNTSKPD
jgi:hypothetical protein